MSIILFLLIFGVVVISHEFGHFLLAKANGIHVVEFSVRSCLVLKREIRSIPSESCL